MTTRHLQRLGRQAILGGGSLAGLLLGWTGAGTLSAQPSALPVGPQSVAVQSAAPVQRNYLNKRIVQLPIQINESARATIQEIQLYSKDHPASAWVLREKARPTQQAFKFEAPADGEYWFTMVTVDKQGKSYPSDLRNEPPGLSVVIDTQAPSVELTNLGATPEGQMIQVDVADLNLDNPRVHICYQAGDKAFRPLEPVPGRGNVYCIPAQAVCTGLVQVIAEDLAGNLTTRQERLTSMKSPRTETVNPQPVVVDPPQQKTTGSGAPSELPKNVVGNAPPIGSGDRYQVQRNAPAAPERPSFPRPDGSQGPHWIDEKSNEPAKNSSENSRDSIGHPVVDGGLVQTSSNMSKPSTGPSLLPTMTPTKYAPQNRQFVNSTKVYLDYQIENAAQASVAKVEVWLTRDQGQSWHKHSDVSGRKSPIEVQLPGDGVYGLTLVACNGATPAAPPVPGDQPDGWIEVDTTKPSLWFNDIQTNFDRGQATVLIRWTAHDKNLADAPVDLFFAVTPQGPWLAIAKSLPAEGQHRWTPPAGLGIQAHLKLVARDAAGNISVCGTLEPVSLAPPAPPSSAPSASALRSRRSSRRDRS